LLKQFDTIDASPAKNSRDSKEKLATGFLRRSVIECFERHPEGLTCHSLAEFLNIQMNTSTSQITKARQDGLIEAIGTHYHLGTKRNITLWGLCQNKPRQTGESPTPMRLGMTRKNAIAILKECTLGVDLFDVTVSHSTATGTDIHEAIKRLVRK